MNSPNSDANPRPCVIQPVPNLTLVSAAPNSPIVRVVETRVLRKQSLNDLQGCDDDDMLGEAYDSIVTEAAEKLVLQELAAEYDPTGDIDPPACDDPEINALADSFADDADRDFDGELDRIVGVVESAGLPHNSESLMRTDDDDCFSDEPTPIPDEVLESAFDEELDETDSAEQKYTTKANEENMKDEPYTGAPKTGAVKQATEKGTLDYLKSVEGRVLTVLEAALPDKEHRTAVKTLIKKEFRREMNRVGRTTQVSEEEEL